MALWRLAERSDTWIARRSKPSAGRARILAAIQHRLHHRGAYFLGAASFAVRGEWIASVVFLVLLLAWRLVLFPWYEKPLR
jgi:hypothetical protein